VQTNRRFDIYVDGLKEPFQVIADPSEADLIDARKRALLKMWQKRRFASGRLPRRSELDADLLEELKLHLMYLTVQADGDLRYLEYGEAIAKAYGKDMTGRRTSEFPAPLSKAFLSLYHLALKQAIPYATRHLPPPPIPAAYWHRLILPLDEAQRGKVDRFLVCNIPVFR
jgi:hypothetical protein